MKVEIKNLKYAEWASQETNCFDASVYIDGKRVGTVRNDGSGGPNFYHPHSVEQTLQKYAATLPPTVVIYDNGNGEERGEMPLVADDIIHELLMEHLYQGDLKRNFKSYILFVRDNKVMSTKKLTPAQLISWLAHPELPAKLKSDKILNLMPFAEALKIYIDFARGPKLVAA